MAKVLICGMTPETARRYLVVRKEVDMIIEQVDTVGRWLGEFDKIKVDGLCKTLTRFGLLIVNATAQIQDYLDNEFVSVEKIRAAADELTKHYD
jgi:hypothetical protein